MIEIVIPRPEDTPVSCPAHEAVLRDAVRAYVSVALQTGLRDIPVSAQIVKVFRTVEDEFAAAGWTVHAYQSQRTAIISFKPTPIEAAAPEPEPAPPAEDPDVAKAMMRPEKTTAPKVTRQEEKPRDG